MDTEREREREQKDPISLVPGTDSWHSKKNCLSFHSIV